MRHLLYQVRVTLTTERCPLKGFVVYFQLSFRLSQRREEIVGQWFLSLAQLVVAIVLSAISAYLAFYLFQWFTRDLDEWQELREGNAAVGVVLGAILISVAIIIRPALEVNTASWDIGNTAAFARVLMVEAVQLAVGLVLAVLTLALALALFAALTRGIDEVAELRNGNLAMAGLLAGVVIGMGLLVSQAVQQVMIMASSSLV
jgi:uncharacterized membrane protein YjfL (UPF0719 family)